MSAPRVRCYAGAGSPERPVAFEWEGAWLEVAAVLRQARTPEGLVFHVLAGDGRRYELVWAETDDSWAVRMNESITPNLSSPTGGPGVKKTKDQGESHV